MKERKDKKDIEGEYLLRSRKRVMNIVSHIYGLKSLNEVKKMCEEIYESMRIATLLRADKRYADTFIKQKRSLLDKGVLLEFHVFPNKKCTLEMVIEHLQYVVREMGNVRYEMHKQLHKKNKRYYVFEFYLVDRD